MAEAAKKVSGGHTARGWIACHDTLVCSGAKQIQKWCVREGDEKGPLIAVMLTKEVARMLAAAPDLRDAVETWMKFFDTMPKGQFRKLTFDVGLMNDGFIKSRTALSKAGEV